MLKERLRFTTKPLFEETTLIFTPVVAGNRITWSLSGTACGIYVDCESGNNSETINSETTLPETTLPETTLPETIAISEEQLQKLDEVTVSIGDISTELGGISAALDAMNVAKFPENYGRYSLSGLYDTNNYSAALYITNSERTDIKNYDQLLDVIQGKINDTQEKINSYSNTLIGQANARNEIAKKSKLESYKASVEDAIEIEREYNLAVAAYNAFMAQKTSFISQVNQLNIEKQKMLDSNIQYVRVHGTAANRDQYDENKERLNESIEEAVAISNAYGQSDIPEVSIITNSDEYDPGI